MTTRTFVLVHGAWHGGWCWRRVAERLRSAGHQVFAPACTGLGERSHLLSKAIDLSIFIDDIVGVLECEELTDVVLVGHSFGGVVITGAADRVPQRLRHLVFVDAAILGDGECAMDRLPPDEAAERMAAAQAISGGISLPVPPPAAFGVHAPADVAWLRRRLTPHPLATYTDRLRLSAPFGHDLPKTYVACTQPAYPPLEGSRCRARNATGWRWREIAAGHDAMVTAPDPLSAVLLQVP